jgi:DNA-binding transcriptional MerR regulator
MAEQTRPVYVRAGDVARLFHVSPKTVARWSNQGRLPHSVTLGGHRRYPLNEMRELAGRMQAAPSTAASGRQA